MKKIIWSATVLFVVLSHISFGMNEEKKNEEGSLISTKSIIKTSSFYKKKDKFEVIYVKDDKKLILPQTSGVDGVWKVHDVKCNEKSLIWCGSYKKEEIKKDFAAIGLYGITNNIFTEKGKTAFGEFNRIDFINGLLNNQNDSECGVSLLVNQSSLFKWYRSFCDQDTKSYSLITKKYVEDDEGLRSNICFNSSGTTAFVSYGRNLLANQQDYDYPNPLNKDSIFFNHKNEINALEQIPCDDQSVALVFTKGVQFLNIQTKEVTNIIVDESGLAEFSISRDGKLAVFVSESKSDDIIHLNIYDREKGEFIHKTHCAGHLFNKMKGSKKSYFLPEDVYFVVHIQNSYNAYVLVYDIRTWKVKTKIDCGNSTWRMFPVVGKTGSYTIYKDNKPHKSVLIYDINNGKIDVCETEEIPHFAFTRQDDTLLLVSEENEQPNMKFCNRLSKKE